MQILDVKGFEIYGLKTRTSNAGEVNLGGKIAALWDKFANLDIKKEGEIYAIYHEYESDFNGEYSLIIGTRSNGDETGANLERICVQSGRYAVFGAEDLDKQNLTIGEANLNGANLTISLWQAVWKFFESSNLKRAYSTDFELYADGKTQIYVALK